MKIIYGNTEMVYNSIAGNDEPIYIDPNVDSHTQFKEKIYPMFCKNVYITGHQREGILCYMIEIFNMDSDKMIYFYDISIKNKTSLISEIINNPFMKPDNILLDDVLDDILKNNTKYGFNSKDFDNLEEIQRKYQNEKKIDKLIVMAKDELKFNTNGINKLMTRISNDIWKKKKEYIDFVVSYGINYKKTMNFFYS